MAFMEPQIEYGTWYEVETTSGTEFIPADLVELDLDEAGDAADVDSTNWADIVAALRDYCEGKPTQVLRIEGWGARLSAPGYLDCTPWAVFDSEKDAEDYLKETYGDEDDDDEEGEADE